jgi:putative ABC transport system permease protein
MLAAAHSWVLAGLGCGVGLGLGVAVGAAAGWVSSRADRYGTGGYMVGDGTPLPGLVAVPWVPLLLVLVLLPVVAAAIGWVSVRRAPALVRRTV